MATPMHELGIAQGILDIVQQYVPQEQAADVRSVKVRVGQLAGVVAESLEFSFQALIADTPWQTAQLQIHRVPTVAGCNTCNSQFEIEDIAFLCPTCGSTRIRMISGTDLQVVEIEMHDEHAEAS
jgi:hydrogenase nickel incorporation protein HypA/HybF